MGKIHSLSLQASISDESLRVCNTHTLKPSFGTGVRCDVAMMSILRRFGIHPNAYLLVMVKQSSLRMMVKS